MRLSLNSLYSLNANGKWLIANKICKVEKMLISARHFIYPIIIGKCNFVGVKV